MDPTSAVNLAYWTIGLFGVAFALFQIGRLLLHWPRPVAAGDESVVVDALVVKYHDAHNGERSAKLSFTGNTRSADAHTQRRILSELQRAIDGKLRSLSAADQQ